jgi:hypothetical protein
MLSTQISEQSDRDQQSLVTQTALSVLPAMAHAVEDDAEAAGGGGAQTL